MVNAGGSFNAYDEKGLKPDASLELTVSWANAWLSTGARFNADQISPYVEGGGDRLAKVGLGASYVPGKGMAPHFFLGVPIPILSRNYPMFCRLACPI